jgi:hypothetical protein
MALVTFRTVVDIAELKTYLGNETTRKAIEVLGYYAENDGGGGTFYWDDTSSDTDNGGTVIKPTAAGITGRWHRVYSGYVNVRWFGAKGDDSNDDTAAVHAARDVVAYGTLFFPAGTYKGNFFFKNCNILGAGYTSRLKPYTTNETTPTAVVRIGSKNLSLPKLVSTWQNNTMSHITIDGDNRLSDGIVFEHDPSSSGDNALAGRWHFEEVNFQYCNIGMFKKYGNIGNTYTNCNWTRSNIGYFAQEGLYMHSGCERFNGGHFEKCDKAGVFFKASGQIGQVIFDGTILEQNAGFGMLFKITNGARMLPVAGITLRGVWMEANATSGVSVTIDGVTYPSADLRYMRFEGCRGVSMHDGMLHSLTLIGSSVATHNCLIGSIYLSTPTYKIDVDETSTLTAYDAHQCNTPSEHIFVHSLAYDGASDITGTNTPGSMWGPLRTVTQHKQSNREGVPGVMISKRFDGTQNTYQITDGISWIDSVQTYAGVLSSYSAKFTLAPGQSLHDTDGFVTTVDKYYFWSIHCLLLEGDSLRLNIKSDIDQHLGQVVLKKDEWTCSYGIKRAVGVSNPVSLYASNGSVTNSAEFLVGDYQVLEFDTMEAATAYANSRAFSDIQRPWTEVGAYANVRSGVSPSFEREYGFESVVRNATGHYTLSFNQDIGTAKYSLSGSVIGTDAYVYVVSQTSTDVEVKLIDTHGNLVDYDFSVTIF